jgi:hypothetical protein
VLASVVYGNGDAGRQTGWRDGPEVNAGSVA